MTVMPSITDYEIIIIGSGFAGAVCARQLAEVGYKVGILEKRNHIAGNAFDHTDAHGVRVHKYGPHIFHTNSQEVWDYLNRFSEFRHYEHKVHARRHARDFSMPINRTTLEQYFGYTFKTDEALKKFLANKIQAIYTDKEKAENSQEFVERNVGVQIFQDFFRHYTRKQWQHEASELQPSVCARVPLRTNRDDRYFTDRFQGIPRYGYTALFEKLLDQKNINIHLEQDFFISRQEIFDLLKSRRIQALVYTGPLDQYFDNKLGALPYRSLRFEFQHLRAPFKKDFLLQRVGTVNYCGDEPFTRSTEFRHLTGQSHQGSTLCREYAQDYVSGKTDPYYPLPTDEATKLAQRYRTLAQKERIENSVYFVGRLAQYQYYNMDQVVAAALHQSREIINELS